MVRRIAVMAVVVGCLVSTVVASAAAGRGGGLRLEVLSGPAKYLSGGAARIRVVVPRSVPLPAAAVAVDGVDVTGEFVPDDQAPHALEGVVRGLPLGSSTVTASVARRARATVTLVNHPVTGPMFSGPQQPDFFCATPEHLAGFGLTGPFLDDDCSLPTRVDHVYRSTAGTWLPYDPAAPRPADMSTTPAGGWKRPQDAVQEGCPYVTALCPSDVDVWSARNTTPPDGNGVRPRTEGDVGAMRAAYRSGLVFDGRIDIPIIDWRHYLDEELDMHNARQSFASRQRIVDRRGSAANQVVWFTDARPARAFDQTPMALAVMDQWLGDIRANPSRGVVGNKPAEAVDSCFATDGTLVHRGRDAWRGTIDGAPAGPCTQRFPIHGTSRTVAGGPFDEQLFKCAVQPVRAAVARGVYGSWRPTAAEVARLEQIFPTGVCDYREPDVGRPR